MEDNSIKLTREELYERVWSTPATKLAKEFGISDAALGNDLQEAEHSEALPQLQQLAVRRRVHKEKLQPIKQGVPEVTYIYPHQPVKPFVPDNPEVLAQIEQESQPANSILGYKFLARVAESGRRCAAG